MSNQRKDLQGKENPAGSGKYPEPKWLGMIQHDMMMWDHGMPGPDGKVSPEQRREADVNIEFQMNSKLADASQKLAWAFKAANDKYATDYPADRRTAHDQHRLDAVHESRRGHQPARKRARHAHRRRLGSELASAERCVHDLQRQGFSSRAERGTDDALWPRSAYGGDGQEVILVRIRGAGSGIRASG